MNDYKSPTVTSIKKLSTTNSSFKQPDSTLFMKESVNVKQLTNTFK